MYGLSTSLYMYSVIFNSYSIDINRSILCCSRNLSKLSQIYSTLPAIKPGRKCQASGHNNVPEEDPLTDWLWSIWHSGRIIPAASLLPSGPRADKRIRSHADCQLSSSGDDN